MWVARFLLAIIVAVWLLTKSRSGFLAVCLVGTLAFFALRFVRSPAVQIEVITPSRPASRWRLAILVVGLLAAIGFGIVLLSQDSLVLAEAPKSILYRLEYWQATARMIMDHPWTGVGLGNFQSYYAAYKLPAASELIADPHNWLFDLAANCSPLFLVVTIVALVWFLGAAWTNLHEAKVDEPLVETTGAFHSHAFWIGAVVSFVLTSLAQLLFGQLIDFDATILGFIAVLAAWYGLRGWPLTLRAIRCAALLAVITMLVCLLASGCWQSSGLAIPLAVCLALACPSRHGHTGPAWHKPYAKTTLASVAATVVVLMVFMFQTWQPFKQVGLWNSKP